MAGVVNWTGNQSKWLYNHCLCDWCFNDSSTTTDHGDTAQAVQAGPLTTSVSASGSGETTTGVIHGPSGQTASLDGGRNHDASLEELATSFLVWHLNESNHMNKTSPLAKESMSAHIVAHNSYRRSISAWDAHCSCGQNRTGHIDIDNQLINYGD